MLSAVAYRGSSARKIQAGRTLGADFSTAVAVM